ncbi:dipeptidase [Candidatus Poriferisocius sp.]|uniref:dipeptidase n=1 Tax=Candidatus Poriferisocius sp. TaxID=3101276 RepID=UPI003B01B973
MVMPHLPIADSHNDLLLGCMHRRERGVADPFGEDWLAGLRAGGVVFQVLPIFTEEQFIGEAALRRTLEIISLAREIADRHIDDVAIVECATDIDQIIDSGRIALLIALEGAEPIGSSLSIIETFWNLGVRMASLTWNRRTMMADGIGETDTGGRLSSLGVEAVQEMNRLGMVVDISHLSAPGVTHLSEVATRPFVATHSSCRALCDHPRNLTDDQMSLVADSGGFVAVNAFGAFVSSSNPTVDGFIDHLEHAAAVIGGRSVAVGADFIYDLFRMVDPVLGRQMLVDPEDLPVIADLKAPADYPNLVRPLIGRLGFEQAAHIASENMLDFFRVNLPCRPAHSQ